MGRRRDIKWSRGADAERQQKLDARPPVREERLRTQGSLVAWRGNSGKRYVFKFADADACQAPSGEAVLVAVRREDGVPTLLDAALTTDREQFEDWRRDVIDGGATEIQVHTLFESSWEASGIVEDLGFEVDRPQAFNLGF